MKLAVALRLGRISNLPTVWTNCLTGMVLFTGTTPPKALASSLLAHSLLYTGGMFLNDAFDADFDRRAHRAGETPRPIVAGEVAAREVFLWGFAQLALALALLAGLTGQLRDPAVLSASGLAGLIVLYDRFHKENPLSPLLMALCRVGVYVTSGLAAASVLAGVGVSPELGVASSLALSGGLLGGPGWGALAFGCACLLVYLMSLTWLAKREGRGVATPVPISGLIAGISLLDAALLLAAGAPRVALLAVLGFFATLRLQRFIRGT